MEISRAAAREQLQCKASEFRTICEVQREIFDFSRSLWNPDRERLQELVIDAFIMGKKMDDRLRQYKADWDAGFYDKNTDRAADRLLRLGKP